MKTFTLGPEGWHYLPQADQNEIADYLANRGLSYRDCRAIEFVQTGWWNRHVVMDMFFRDELTGKWVWDENNDGPKMYAVRLRVLAFPRTVRRCMELL